MRTNMSRSVRPIRLFRGRLPPVALAFAALLLSGCERKTAADKTPKSSPLVVVGKSSAGAASSNDGSKKGRSKNPPAASPSATPGPSGSALAPTLPSGPVLGALSWQTRVRAKPSLKGRRIGYLRAGSVVELGGESAGTKGCKGGWMPIKPRGFVCIRKGVATLDRAHKLLAANRRRPDPSQALPYMYGIVRRPGPIYGRLPSRAEAARAEPGLSKRMDKWLELEGPNGAGFRWDYWFRWQPESSRVKPLDLWNAKSQGPSPAYFENEGYPPGDLADKLRGKKPLVVGKMKRHNGFAFIGTAVRDGRRYGISARQLLMPVDRLRPIVGSAYHGVRIPQEIHFPFALIRRRKAPAYEFDGKKRVRKGTLPHRAAVQLTGKQRMRGIRLYYEMADGRWVSDKYASRLDPAKHMPKWGKNGERWLDVNITKQTLVAYDGEKAVFATLVSTGEAGLGDPETSKATKRGIFRVHTKHLSVTMDSDIVGEEFELRDIPYVQYFEGGYALHAAYWHDDFGRPRSHGCINLAPEDAKYLFGFTKPHVPVGWHSVREPLRGSVVFVHP